ncbi:MAG: hydroxymethylglutaryl-CoA lyase [Saprospiraceae bacterium]|nr:hydroxymethylglutaryl-CoA lyase [Saprospiraceae bacterium]
MQGLSPFIPTRTKIEYLQSLLAVGFDTLDFGSFVSPKAIPQMADTAEVLEGLDLTTTQTKLLAIIANVRGANDAAVHPQIDYLGYPFSISETFQLRNTNATIEESLTRVSDILEIADTSNKEVVIYISMGFGNPYGDPWNVDIVLQWVYKLMDMGVRIFSLSDTIGVSSPDNIHYLFESLIPALPQIEFGAHLHTTPTTWQEKVQAAYQSGCRRFDGALKGYGGCPMAREELTGNMPMENMVQYFQSLNATPLIQLDRLNNALSMVSSVFPHAD